jgi:glycosyltransferase involved in cell wall biosynthesis
MLSVIATVFNEGDNIDYLMQSLVRQTRRPDEVVIVDGGSRDDTVKRMNAYKDRLPLKIIMQAGANISQGRNLAMKHATGEVLAITDAGVRLPDSWLEELTRPFRENAQTTVSCGFFRADPRTLFEVALGATTLPLEREIDPATFLPSSRSVAVKRSVALQVGGYPEWLDYCEDLVFDFALKATQPPFAFAPKACVAFRPRPNFRAFFKQYYRYARGDGKANLWLKRHVIRYGIYGVGLPVLLVAGLVVHPLAWALMLVGGLLYCWTPFRRLPEVMQHSPRLDMGAWLQVIALIPLIRLVGDVAKMVGYPVGLWWRWKNPR